MYDIKLTYFDFHGGRGEPIRLALHIGDIDFEDQRVPVKEWPAIKAQMPFRALPTMTVDGETLTQSNTILRFAGQLAGLIPSDLVESMQCDEILDAIEDIGTQVVATFFMSDEDKKVAREKLASGAIPLYLSRFSAQLQQRGDQFMAGDRLSVADLKLFVWLKNLRSGILDHIPTDLVDNHSPNLAAFCDRMAQHPKISAYYQSFKG